jgi:hypothetical protein
VRRGHEACAIEEFGSILPYVETPGIKTEINTEVDYLMLMQHYGCPTRLLDWTKSPYVATYFSVADLKESNTAALYVLNLTKYQSTIASKLPLDDYNSSVLTWIPDRIFKRLLDDETVTFPIPLAPKPITDREFKQQTAFLFDSQLEKPLQETFIGDQSTYLWKIELGPGVKDDAIKDLSLMNIDGLHLFQGLQGLALRAKISLLGRLEFGHTTVDPDYIPY